MITPEPDMTEPDMIEPVILVSHTYMGEQHWVTSGGPYNFSIQKSKDSENGFIIHDLEIDADLWIEDVDKIIMALKLIREKAEELRGEQRASS